VDKSGRFGPRPSYAALFATVQRGQKNDFTAQLEQENDFYFIIRCAGVLGLRHFERTPVEYRNHSSKAWEIRGAISYRWEVDEIFLEPNSH
jgi:hypothetical protein